MKLQSRCLVKPVSLPNLSDRGVYTILLAGGGGGGGEQRNTKVPAKYVLAMPYHPSHPHSHPTQTVTAVDSKQMPDL